MPQWEDIHMRCTSGNTNSGERWSYQCERSIEDSYKDISHSEVHNEQVGSGLCALVFQHHMAHHGVSEQGDDYDERVSCHQYPLDLPVMRLPKATPLVDQSAPVLQHPVVKVQEEKFRCPVIQLPRDVK